RPTVLKIILRAAGVLYAAASLIVLLIAILLFYLYEVSDSAQEFWKNTHEWASVKVGMTEPDVARILGPPSRRGKESAGYFLDEGTDDVYIYQMQMVTIDDRIVEFKTDATSALKEMKVIGKIPGDETVNAYLTEWKPFGRI